MIEKSVGTTMFQNFYVENGRGEEQDVLDGGDVSCAVYVSSILLLNQLVDKGLDTPRVRVERVREDLQASGWYEIGEDTIEPGAVIFWDVAPQSEKKLHTHVGFYLGDDIAVSNCYVRKVPVKHHFRENTTGGARPIMNVWIHKTLKESYS